MRRFDQAVAALVVAACVLAPGLAWAQHEKEEKMALEAAKAWLALVDTGKYAESWDEASSLFRGAVTKEEWVKVVQGVRKPLGKVVSRVLESTTYSTTLPGAPDGQYVAIRYKTVFENKAQAIETVTPMLDKDGAWRVAGYYLE